MTSPPEPRKVAIVTGASQGIGAGIAAGFLGLGYRVVAASLSIPPSHAVDVHTVQGDISQVETAQRIVEETLDRFGRIDTLVNNAGIFIGKPFLDYTHDDFAAMTAVNLDGFLPHAARRPSHGGAKPRTRRQHHHEPRRSRAGRLAICPPRR